MTPAMAQLAKHQKRHPPLYASLRGGDRARQLYHVLAPCLPQKLQDPVSSGTVTIGELGRNSPEIQTIPIDGHGAVIEFNSGMIDFVYAVVRTLAGSMVRVTKSGPKNEPALPVTDVARQTAALFRQWKWPNCWIWVVRRIAYPPFEITQKVHARVGEVAKNTELFLLAHELGHVAIDLALVPPSPEKAEVQADALGCRFIFSLATLGQLDLADLYGAAVLAVRICAGLELGGVVFPKSYPKQAIRLKSLRNAAMSACPSMQYFHEISRIGVAYEDQMDDVEDHIVRSLRVRPPDSERLLIQLIAELLNVALGRLSTREFAGNITDLSAQIPPDIMRQALNTLHGYYVASPPKDSFIDVYMRERMRQSLLQVMEDLPSQVRKLFRK